eukprot:364447-Chlamydomonas_euryale.AAC.21
MIDPRQPFHCDGAVRRRATSLRRTLRAWPRHTAARTYCLHLSPGHRRGTFPSSRGRSLLRAACRGPPPTY